MKWSNKGHEFDDIGNKLVRIKKIYFYGIGGHVKEIYELINNAKEWFDIEMYYVDKSEKVRAKGFEGNEILSPEIFFETLRDQQDYLVVACPLGAVGEEIKDIVVANGIEECDVVTGYDFLYTLIPIYFLYKYDMVFFTSENIVPSSICNLNCRECLNFNPYIKKHTTYTLEEVKKDIDLFFEAVDLVYRFQVTGGEPLLYRHFMEVLSYIDDNYSDKIIRLETVTNGTIIPSEEICDFLAKRHIYVFLDDYTMALDGDSKQTRQTIVNKFREHCVNYCDNYVDKWFKIYPAKEQKKQDELTNFFDKCANPWSTIERGRISACNYELYAQKAGLVEGVDDDFFDLTNYDKANKRQLVEFRLRYNNRGYTSFCEKCAGFSVINHDFYYPAIQAERGIK